MYKIYYDNGTNVWDISKYIISCKMVHGVNIGDMSLDLDIFPPGYITHDVLSLKSDSRIYVTRHGTIEFSGRLQKAIFTDGLLKVQCAGLFSLFDDLGSIGILASTADISLYKKQTPDHRDFFVTFDSKAYTVEESERSVRLVEGVGATHLSSNGLHLPVPVNKAAIPDYVYSLADISYNLPSGFLTYMRTTDKVGNIHASAGLQTTSISSGRRVIVSRLPVSGIYNHTFNIRNTTGGTYTSTSDTGTWYSNLNAARIVLENSVKFPTATIVVAAGGTITITPSSMQNIYNGQRIYTLVGSYSAGNSTYTGESVVVSGVTSTTFRSTFSTAISGAVTFVVPFIESEDILSSYGTLVGLTNILESTSLDIPDSMYESISIKDLCELLSKRGDGSKKYYYWVDSNGLFYFRPKSSNTYYADLDVFELSASLNTIANKIIPISKYEDGTPKELDPVYDYASIEKINAIRAQSYSGNTATDEQATLYATALLQDTVKGSVSTVISILQVYNVQGARVPLYVLKPGDMVIPRNIPLNLLNIVQDSYIIDTKQVDLGTGKITFAFDKPVTSTEALVNFI